MTTQSNRRIARMIALGAVALAGATLSGCVGTYAWSDGHSYGAVYSPIFWWGHHSGSYSRHGYGHGGHWGRSGGHGGGHRGGGHGGRGHR